nr:hypothetical protein 1 [Shahe picorna-like virus 9]
MLCIMNTTNTEKSGTVSMTKFQARVNARSQREKDIIARYKARMEELRKREPKSSRLSRVKNAKSESFLEKIMFSESSGDEAQYEMGFWPQGFSDAMRIARKVERAADSVADLASYFNGKIEELTALFKSTMRGYLWQVPLFCLAFCIADKMGISLFILGGLCPLLMTYLSTFWTEHYEQPRHQGAEDVLSMLATLILSSIMPKNASSTVIAETVLRRVGNFSKSAEGFRALFSTLIEFSEKIINGIADYFKADHVQFMDTTAKVLRNWMTKVDAFETICTYREPTIAELRNAVELQGEGIALKNVAKTTPTIIALNKYLEKLGMLVSVRRGALNAAGCFRQEPAFCLLGGESGVGKTVLQRYIAVSALVFSGVLGNSEGIEQLWAKGASKYWNSYMGQLCLIWDDIFQVKKPASTEESEFMFIIKAVSNFMLPLDFADVESKGRFAFTSPLIVASTNEMDVKSAASNFVRCPEAVSRRISDGYWVKVKDEFKRPGTEFLDYTKWATAFAKAVESKKPGEQVEALIPSAWEFYSHDFEGQPCLGTTPKSINEIIMALADNLKNRMIRHEADLKVSEKYCNAAKGINALSNYDAVAKAEISLKKPSTCHGLFTKITNNDGFMTPPIHQVGTWDEESFVDSQDHFDDEEEDVQRDINGMIEEHTTFVALEERAVDARGNVLNRKPLSHNGLTVKAFVAAITKFTEDKTNYARSTTSSTMNKLRSAIWGNTPSEMPMYDIDMESTTYTDIMVNKWLENHVMREAISEEVEDMKKMEMTFFQRILSALCTFGEMIPVSLKKARDSLLKMVEPGVQFTYDQFIAFKAGNMSAWASLSTKIAFIAIAVSVQSIMLSLMRKLVIATANFFYDCAVALLSAFGVDMEAKEQSHNPEGKKGLPRVEFVRAPTHQGTENHDFTVRKVLSNCFAMTAIQGKDRTYLGSLQFFDGDLAAMPHHFWRQMTQKVQNDTMIEFTNADQDKYNFSMNMRKFLSFPNLSYKESGLDLIFLKMDKRGIKAMKNIKQLLFSEAQMSEFTRISQQVTLHSVQSVTKADNVSRIVISRMESPGLKYLSSFSVQGNEYVQTFQYTANTSQGDCGSPLLLTDSRYHKGIYLGMHFAGARAFTGSRGYATVITREMVDQASEKLGCYTDNFVQDMSSMGITVSECDAQEQCGITGDNNLVDGSVTLLGKVDKPVNSSGKTQLKLSPLGEAEIFGPCPKMPAILHPVNKDGTIIYPMIKSMDPYRTPHEWRDVPNLELCAEVLTRSFSRATKDFPKIVLTPEEAAKGIPSMGVKAIPRDTSPGYPYRLEGSVGKKAWFGNEQEYDLNNPKWFALKRRVISMRDQILEGKRPAVLYVGFLKDELRNKEKVAAVKTRYVSSCPQDYTLLCKMYFGAYIGARLQLNVKEGFGPGMNPITDWSTMVDYLKQAGNNTFAGDFKSFDASQQPYIHQVILDHINAWYRMADGWKEEDEKVRNMLWLELIHSRHLVGKSHEAKYIVQWNKSLPSGHPLTTIVNSLFTVIVIGTAYVKATGDIEGLEEHLKTVPFGDDNVNSVFDKMTELFNQVVLAEELDETFGLTYTDDVKDAELKPFKDIEECTFLQRGIIRDPTAPGGWRAPLAEGSYLWSTYWYRSNKACEDDMFNNIKSMQGEMSQHPQEVWDHRMSQLLPWLKENNLLHKLPFQSREAALQWRMAHVDTWV